MSLFNTAINEMPPVGPTLSEVFLETVIIHMRDFYCLSEFSNKSRPHIVCVCVQRRKAAAAVRRSLCVLYVGRRERFFFFFGSARAASTSLSWKQQQQQR